MVGPEAPLVAGVVDRFRARGLRIVGPDAGGGAARRQQDLRKELFCAKQHPDCRLRYRRITPAEARKAIGRFGFPVVLKADGLAAGKGVVVAHDRAEAEAALATLKGRLVVEEFLRGEEVSFIALCDGRDALPLAPTQDHKAVFDGDPGPNTGGMGAYCDSRILTEAQAKEVLDRVIRPTVEATGFTGFLYAGLMMTEAGPKVLEFNVRLGDPETQPLMHRMASDFVPVLMAAAEGRLAGMRTGMASRIRASAWCWHRADTPAPSKRASRFTASKRPRPPAPLCFTPGHAMGPTGVETAGGRVLGVTASGNDLAAAIHRAYDAVRHDPLRRHALPQGHRTQGAGTIQWKNSGDVAQMDRAVAS